MSPQRVVLVEYLCTNEVTLVFGLRADWRAPKVAEIKLPLADLRVFVVRNFGVQTTRGDATARSVYEKVQSLDLAAWQAFFDPFIVPLRDWAEPGDLLWLVPHDVLHYLPLHALRLDSRYLIERHPIVYTPSASVMKYCQAKRTSRPRKSALVMGDSLNDLPSAREEALAVAQAFNTQAFLGEQASKTRFVQELTTRPEPLDVLHLACHGYFDPAEPLRSGIWLAGNGDGRANLTAAEIFGLEMRADLVVLSACESGINERKPGDELIGLTRALIYAGTPSVLVSLWRVDDLPTALLIQAFYRALANGANKAQALQSAQLALVEMTESTAQQAVGAWCDHLSATGGLERACGFEERAYMILLAAEHYNPRPASGEWHPFSHPAAWAPFILVGDWK